MDEKIEKSESRTAPRRLSAPFSGRWRLEILRSLSEQSPQRLAELRRSVVGISKKVLLDDLRVLQDSGLITRQDLSTKVKKVEYSVAESSRSAIAQMLAAADDIRKFHARSRED
jgi:DNA-binding HxlR family transcriptional regulator